MALEEDLKQRVAKFFRDEWVTRKGQKVPEYSDLKFANDAVELQATVLYADLSESTKLVNLFPAEFSAEVYKSYLHCAAQIIRAEGGAITSYDGDRIMAVFIGKTKNTTAVRAGLKINYACKKIVNPAIKSQYNIDFQAKQTVGIDTSKLFVARTGIRGSNDLVWVGRAANYAAKLTELDPSHPTWITKSVYDRMLEGSKLSQGRNMWESRVWKTMNNFSIYRSSWIWKV